MPETNARIKVCHDTAANFKTNNPTLLVGEWALETDTKKMKIGDGTTAYNALPYSTAEDSDEWRKPDDWPDIRSGVLNNSIYLLVSHKADYTLYPSLEMYSATSDSSAIDVHVDGIKIAQWNSRSNFVFDWETLNMPAAYPITTPYEGVAHIVRLTPSGANATFTAFRMAGTGTNGVLWIHYNIKNAISCNSLLANSTATRSTPICQAITALGDKITLTTNGCRYGFQSASLQTIPEIDFDSHAMAIDYAFSAGAYKKLKISNYAQTQAQHAIFRNLPNLQVLETDAPVLAARRVISLCPSLRKLPPFSFKANSYQNDLIEATDLLAGDTGLKDTVLDASEGTVLKRIAVGGTSSARIDGLKGFTVSNEAPFDSTTSPQIDVSYTGLDRGALVNLFESMPYNVGYTVVGTPTIVDGVVNYSGSSNYLKTIAAPLNTASSFEINLSVKTDEETLAFRSLFGNYNSIKIIKTGGSGTFSISAGGVTTVTNYAINTSYEINIKYDNGQYIISKNGEQIASYAGSAPTTDYPFAIGTTLVGNSSTTDGSSMYNQIDLNETYIKIDGVTWFNGAATRQLDPAATNVGGVTITNGVASGFSQNKYLTLTQNFDNSNISEIVFCGKLSDQHLGYFNYLFYKTGGNLQFFVDTNSQGVLGEPLVYLPGPNASYRFTNFIPTIGQYFWLKYTYDGTDVNLYTSTDGENYTLRNTIQNVIITGTNGTWNIGNGSNLSTHYFGGSIDLNNTYVIANGTKFFSGMVPMTKTCSVVGCTGTADLTADDKAIATGKGWELTVA